MPNSSKRDDTVTPGLGASVLGPIESALGWGVASALFLMMALTFCDVIGRKFLGASIAGVVEMSELLMLAVIFFGLPLCSMRSEHVIFDLLDPFLPRFLKRSQHAFAHIACALLLLGATWLVWGRAFRTSEQGDITAQLQIPLHPFYYATAICCAITALVHFILAARPADPETDEIKAGAL